MDVEHLIGTMIQGALAGGGKRSRGAGRYLRGGGASFLNASTLLTVGGLVWGVIETMQQQGQASGTTAPLPAGAAQAAGAHVPPPPAAPALPGSAPLPPPLPGSTPAQPEADPAAVVPEGAGKLVRLMVSAARADGTLAESEQRAILEHARAAGAEALVAEEIARPTPLARIVDGISDARQRADLYVLAYSIVRADETLSGAERIYLAQLAGLLGIEPSAVERLERDAAARIDQAAGMDGQ